MIWEHCVKDIISEPKYVRQQCYKALKHKKAGACEQLYMHLAKFSHTYPGPLGSLCGVSELEADEKKFYSGK